MPDDYAYANALNKMTAFINRDSVYTNDDVSVKSLNPPVYQHC